MFLTRGKKFSASLQKLFLPVSEAFFLFLTMPGNAMFAFKASLVRFTLGRFALLSKITSSREIHSTQNFSCSSYFGLKDFHEIIFAGGTIGNKFVSKFKMSLWENMLLSIKNKSSPQFFRLNGTKCRLRKVIFHLI